MALLLNASLSPPWLYEACQSGDILELHNTVTSYIPVTHQAVHDGEARVRRGRGTGRHLGDTEATSLAITEQF